MAEEQGRKDSADTVGEGGTAAAINDRIMSQFRGLLSPEWVRQHEDDATRPGQWMAFALLGLIVPVTFTVLLLLHRIMVILVGLFFEDNLLDTALSLITVLDLAAFIFSAWLWFVFVRTAGFGWFNIWGSDPC